ncbi:FAD-binding oxidoreductase [Halovulum dunhuangense]|uniref:FAD-binding oxidoreductase n=1 Tax=Halovulum dunhuangense TaxID=1505036 RepID=A0A849L0R0_9RHOB|nr:FAD-binding oxidoreductase [Halovulum dunhuangense]NNU79854.1 FAD-binding oxidoreductase [Halovulum dunhuangense]
MTDLLRENDPDGEHPASYYRATAAPLPDCPPLDGDRCADVCIIGAGYTGLSAALELAGQGLDVVLLEANRVGWGASGRNGGQLGSGQRLGQRRLERMAGERIARQLWDLAEEAKQTARDHIAAHGIACDLKPGVLHADLHAHEVRDSHADAEHLRKVYGYDQITPLDRGGIAAALGTDIYAGGALDMGAGHLHPLNYALGLARAAMGGGVTVHEKTRVRSVSDSAPHRVVTDRGTVTAGHVLFACNGYHGGVDRHGAARVMPINNFIIATEPLGEARARALIRDDVAVADSKFVVNYYRLSADHRLLFGGGETYGYRFPADIAGLVRPNMLKVYPQLQDVRIDHAWGGTLGITTSRMPYFGATGHTRLAAGGFSGHGVAMATLAGRLMGRYVLGAREGFETFARLQPRGFPGGDRARHPLLVLAMSWYALRDRLGI